MMLGMFALQSADRPDEPKKPTDLSGNPNKFDITRVDYSKLFRRSGLNDDQTSIFYYLEAENFQALQQLIDQAKKDGRVDVLEKALDYAVREKKIGAVIVLLSNGVPINLDLLEQTVKGITYYFDADDREKWKYQDKKIIFDFLILQILTMSSRWKELEQLVSYLQDTRNGYFLNDMLDQAINVGVIPVIEFLIDEGAFIPHERRLHEVVRQLNAMSSRDKTGEGKKRIRAIIERLYNAYERLLDMRDRNENKRENEQRRGQ